MSKHGICTGVAASGVKACAARNLHKSRKKKGRKEGRKTHRDFPGLPLCSQHLAEGTKWEISASPFCPKLELSIIRVVRNSLSCGPLVCAPFTALNETLKERYYRRLINIAALNIAGTSNGSKVATASPDRSIDLSIYQEKNDNGLHGSWASLRSQQQHNNKVASP